jgi:hypothetical protein
MGSPYPFLLENHLCAMEGGLEISQERPNSGAFFLGGQLLDRCRQFTEFFGPDIRRAGTDGMHTPFDSREITGLKSGDRQTHLRFRMRDKQIDHFDDEFVAPEPTEPIQRFQVDLRHVGDGTLLRRICL